MLNLNNISKIYRIGDIETKALDGINVGFREREFVAILGPSGSGKTTCLNIIGGLDRYDNGEMTIKGKKTKDFKNKDWDAYRNNSVGFVFQSYNLITHLSIVANVELSLTLSGISYAEKRKRALAVLEKVGLKDHLHKNPNQLSGGQMQRVAIARALVNDPEILLCDEPTGALDTATSVQILDLIKEIAQERLVIMVTHNPELAEKYADRIIQFKDGKITSDNNPYEENLADESFNIKKTSMSFFTALNLSYNNIRTKKGRTFLTSFASSIGIIGIAIILSLSTGFQKQIDKFQNDAMAEFPIIISQNAMQMDKENMKAMHERMEEQSGKAKFEKAKKVFLYDPAKETFVHKNIITEKYTDYLDKIDPKVCNSIGYTRLVNMNLLRKIDGTVKPVEIKSGISSMLSGTASTMNNNTDMQNSRLSSYPIKLNKKEGSYLEKNYTLLAGEYPKDENDMVLVLDTKNRVSIEILKSLGYKTKKVESMEFGDFVNKEFKLINNDDFYIKIASGNYIPNTDYKEMYNSNKSITLKISGIVRQSPDTKVAILSPGLAYSDELSKKIIENNKNSKIVQAQKDVDYNIMTRKDLTKEEKEGFLSVLGGNATPYMVMIYPRSFESKDSIIKYLDNFNKGKSKKDKVVYTDLADTISELTGGIMDGITLVLIAFAAISLVVSLIMISIITYTSVLERTKEIGILKALGARKKDITRVFDAETCILGIFSGTLGVIIAWLCTFPINVIIKDVSKLENVAQLQITHVISLVIISTILTMVGGHIPARIASKKDAVEALRSE